MLQAAAKLIVRMIPNVYRAGRVVGKGGGVLAIGQAIKFVKKQLSNGAEAELKLTKVEDLYLDSSGVVNRNGDGTHVASLYDDSDGNSYLDLGDKILTWNGNAWV